MSDAMELVKRAALALTPAEWRQVARDVNAEFASRHEVERERESQRLAQTMDMTPEGYVREFASRGRQNHAPLLPWEKAYQDAGVIERAERLDYIEIGRGVSCPVTLTAKGEALVQASTAAPSR